MTPVQGQPFFLPRSHFLQGNLLLLWHLNSFSLVNLESGRTFNFPVGFHLVLISYLFHQSATLLWSALISGSPNPCNLLLSEAYGRLIGERECLPLRLLLSQFINFLWLLVVLFGNSCFIQYLPYPWLLCSLIPSICLPSFPKHIYCWRAPGPLGPQPFVLQHLTFTLSALSLSCLIPFNFPMSSWSL